MRGAMTARASLAQAQRDVDAARARLEETYHEWAAQLAREAASDALGLVEEQVGIEGAPGGRIGSLPDRLEALGPHRAFDDELRSAGSVLDDVLEGTLEPDHDPSLAWKEGGSEDFTTREDAEEAIAAAQRIVDACRKHLQEAEQDEQDERGEQDGEGEKREEGDEGADEGKPGERDPAAGDQEDEASPEESG